MDRFSQLPEGCVSEILSFTSPRDVCKSSAISSVFREAADSDAVWERFLPSDYRDIIGRSVPPVAFATKKQLYFSLANSSVLLDAGEMSFTIDKRSSKKCYMVGARSLLIARGDAPKYWTWLSLPQSRFSKVATLVKGWSLDTKGRINTRLLSPKTTYGAYFVYKIEQENMGLEYEARASLRFLEEGKGGAEEDTTTSTTVYLKSRSSDGHDWSSVENGMFPWRRDDGWMEVELGEFFNKGDDGEVEIQLLETEFFKFGLTVEGIEFRPKADDAYKVTNRSDSTHSPQTVTQKIINLDHPNSVWSTINNIIKLIINKTT